MNNRVFYAVLIIITAAFVFSGLAGNKSEKKVALVGVGTYTSQGEQHIQQGQPHPPYNSELPSSGDHYADPSTPAEWGVYTREVPAEVFLHNMEHGGVVIAYSPKLPQNQVKRLQSLFAPPYADKNFLPGKAILTPRESSKRLIEMASWTRTYNLDTFDEAKIKQFYLENVSNKRAPESFGGPNNTPINQAKERP